MPALGKKILEYIKRGELVIEPFTKEIVRENGLDLGLEEK